MNIDPRPILQDYGLDQKETEVYLALLKNGPGSSQQLSKATDILRQSTYDILNRLMHKGMITSVVENNVTTYAAQKPQILLELLEEKKRSIGTILPYLTELESLHAATGAEQFKGMRGLKALYEEFLLSKKTIYTIQPEIPETVLKEYFVRNFLTKRVERKIPIKILRESIATEFQKEIVTDSKKLREVRLLASLDQFSSHIVICDDKIVLLNYENLTGVRITDKTFAQSFLLLFNILWAQGKKV